MSRCESVAVETGKRCKNPGKDTTAGLRCHMHEPKVATDLSVSAAVLAERRREAAERCRAQREQEQQYRELAAKARPVEGAHGARRVSLYVRDGGWE